MIGVFALLVRMICAAWAQEVDAQIDSRSENIIGLEDANTASALPVEGPVFHDYRFGYSVDLPPGRTGCVPFWPERGVTILLNPQHTCANPKIATPPYIAFFPTYNMDDDEGPVRGFAVRLCKRQRDAGTWIRHRLADHSGVEGCMVNYSDGTIGAALTTIFGSAAHEVPHIELRIYLHTTKERFAKDWQTLKIVLKTVKIAERE